MAGPAGAAWCLGSGGGGRRAAMTQGWWAQLAIPKPRPSQPMAATRCGVLGHLQAMPASTGAGPHRTVMSVAVRLPPPWPASASFWSIGRMSRPFSSWPPPPPPSSFPPLPSSLTSSLPPSLTSPPTPPTPSTPSTPPTPSPSASPPKPEAHIPGSVPNGAGAAPVSASPSSSPSSPSSPSIPSARAQLYERFSQVMDNFQARVLVASQTLNDLTGYSAIEQIKARNAQLEIDLEAAQAELRRARREYQAVNERRAATQREVTTLLARKDSWGPSDLERFTTLYRADHELEASAASAVERLKEAEATEARLSADVTAGILKRYHEEQVWSDRIRRQSTWGTWGLMAVNVALFIVLQFFAEPWRRSRLMRGIADAESGVLDDVRNELANVRTVLASVTEAVSPTAVAAEAAAAEAAAAAAASPEATWAAAAAQMPPRPPTAPLRLFLSFPPTWPWTWPQVKAFASSPSCWRAWMADICDDRPVALRMRDVSMIAIQSAATGAIVVGTLVFALRR